MSSDVTKALHESLGEMKDFLLFLHAATGCDNTSALFGRRKAKVFNKLMNDSELRTKVAVFNEERSSADDIADTGEKFSCVVYGGKVTDNWNQLRYELYLKKTVTKQTVTGNFQSSCSSTYLRRSKTTFIKNFLTSSTVEGMNLDSTQ